MTEQHWETLEAVVNRVLPVDEYPNGWDAGVGDYLRRQFAGDLQDCVRAYQDGLEALERESQTVRQTTFTALPTDVQDALLTRIETGPFFRMVVEHALEGFYADPGNGGNRDGMAWQMIGFEVRG